MSNLDENTIEELEQEFGIQKETSELKADFIKRIQKQTKKAAPKSKADSDTEKTTVSELKAELKEFTDNGLDLKTEGDTFTMSFSGREDSGSLSQPVGSLRMVAERLVGAETLKRIRESK